MNKYLTFFTQPPITRKFKSKLLHNFHTLTPFEMVIYFCCIRPFWSKDRQFFFEGSLGLLGQLYATERKVLYNTILEHKPRQCFEIGTYTGGGSTFFLASAFAQNQSGKLITMENSDHHHNKAKNFYANKLPQLNDHIKFVFGSTPDQFESYIFEDEKVDCVFFDGAEVGQQTVDQYLFFLPYFKSGSIIMFHDWNTEKTRIIRPIVLNNPNWLKIAELEPPDSIGMAIFKFK